MSEAVAAGRGEAPASGVARHRVARGGLAQLSLPPPCTGTKAVSHCVTLAGEGVASILFPFVSVCFWAPRGRRPRRGSRGLFTAFAHLAASVGDWHGCVGVAVGPRLAWSRGGGGGVGIAGGPRSPLRPPITSLACFPPVRGAGSAACARPSLGLLSFHLARGGCPQVGGTPGPSLVCERARCCMRRSRGAETVEWRSRGIWRRV